MNLTLRLFLRCRCLVIPHSRVRRVPTQYQAPLPKLPRLGTMLLLPKPQAPLALQTMPTRPVSTMNSHRPALSRLPSPCPTLYLCGVITTLLP